MSDKTREELLAQGGHKDDSDKARMDLLPPEMLWETAKVLTFGAKKYADRNYEHGMDWGRVFGALQRHLWAWWGGEDYDQETGYLHLSHASCCVAMLLVYVVRGIGNDSRATSNENLPHARKVPPKKNSCG